MSKHTSAVFVFLILLGLFVIFYGQVSPVSTGAAFSSMLVERLGLESEPETYDKIVEVYAEHNTRRGHMMSFLGLSILLPSIYGLWTITRPRPPQS